MIHLYNNTFQLFVFLNNNVFDIINYIAEFIARKSQFIVWYLTFDLCNIVGSSLVWRCA